MAQCTFVDEKKKAQCTGRARARGYCMNHYQMGLRGTIPMPPKPEPRGRDGARYDILVNAEAHQIIVSEAEKRDEPRGRVATRWLEERALQEKAAETKKRRGSA